MALSMITQQQRRLGLTQDLSVVYIGQDSDAVLPLAKSCLASVPLASLSEPRNVSYMGLDSRVKLYIDEVVTYDHLTWPFVLLLFT